jgi:hypothetical protein
LNLQSKDYPGKAYENSDLLDKIFGNTIDLLLLFILLSITKFEDAVGLKKLVQLLMMPEIAKCTTPSDP